MLPFHETPVETERTRRVARVLFGEFRARLDRGEGHTANVSAGGLFFRTDDPPEAGQWAEVVLNRANGDDVESIAVAGVVRWSTALGRSPAQRVRGFGLEIRESSPRYETLVAESLRALDATDAA